MKIAVLLGGILYDSQKSLLKGITDYADEHNVTVVVFTCGGDIYGSDEHNIGEFQIYDLPDFEQYDGVIIARNTIQNEEIVRKLEKNLSTLNLPIISIDARMRGATCFEIDNEKAMYEMTDHILMEHPKTDYSAAPILYVSGPKENNESLQRRDGFIKRVEKDHLIAEKDYFVSYGDYWIDSGHDCINRFAEEKNMIPKIIICANDYMAIGVIAELEIMGYKVPNDAVVTGFDNCYEARNHKPRITSVAKPLRKMGYEACRMLNECSSNQQVIQFDVKYLFAESCGCKKRESDDASYLRHTMIQEKTDNSFFSKVLNEMTADMNEVDSTRSMIEAMKPYVKKLNLPYFYLCLCKDEDEEEMTFNEYDYNSCLKQCRQYSETVDVAIAYERGEFIEYDDIFSKEILPAECFRKCNNYIVVPVHYRSNCQGYCVIGKSQIPMESVWFQPLILTVGNAIENIRKQTMMRGLIDNLNLAWITDALTGVYNRFGFYRNVGRVLMEGKERNKEILLLFADLDRLKFVNDTYGHEEGDFYIKTVAQIIKEVCTEAAVVMRYGGDEFVSVQVLEHPNQGRNLMDEIIARVSKLEVLFNKPYPTMVSIGMNITKPDENVSMETLIEQADKEMYKMKQLSKKGRRDDK